METLAKVQPAWRPGGDGVQEERREGVVHVKADGLPGVSKHVAAHLPDPAADNIRRARGVWTKD